MLACDTTTIHQTNTIFSSYPWKGTANDLKGDGVGSKIANGGPSNIHPTDISVEQQAPYDNELQLSATTKHVLLEEECEPRELMEKLYVRGILVVNREPTVINLIEVIEQIAKYRLKIALFTIGMMQDLSNSSVYGPGWWS